MGTYGPNFEFRVVPTMENRGSRFATRSAADYATVMPQGAPVAVTGSVDTLGRATLALSGTGAPPVKGKHGIAIYEYVDGSAFAGDDQNLVLWSDKSTLPFSKAVQVISGPNVKVVFRNTETTTFLQTRSYTGRNMVAELGGSPSVTVGAYLEPHSSPSDTNGYYQVTATLANAWFYVTGIDSTRQEVEAQFLF